MHADESARQCKCVDDRAVYDKKREFVATVLICLCCQSIADLVDVFSDLWVFDNLSTGADLRHNRAPKTILLVLG